MIGFGFHDGGDDGKVDSVGLVDISEKNVTKDVFLFYWSGILYA